MRVAALFDVHGNLPALEAVLADVERAGVDAIVSGGDVVAGPEPSESLARLEAAGARFVRGNADREVVDDPPTDAARWCAVRLSAAERDAVRGWPLTLPLEVEALGPVLFCHASPRSDEEILTRATPEREVAEALAGTTAAAVVCGHTHHQYERRAGGVLVVNAGSVGLPYEGRRGAFWALLGPRVELRRTAYDVPAALEALRATGYPGFDAMFGPSLAEPVSRDEAIAAFESRRGA